MAERLFLGPIVGLSLLIYVGYCASVGGTHVRGKGWVSKEDAPKSYRFTQLLFTFIGISMTLQYFIFQK